MPNNFVAFTQNITFMYLYFSFSFTITKEKLQYYRIIT